MMRILPHIEGDDFKKHNEHRENQRPFQFLMRLNDNFFGVRSNVLLWNPLPIVNETYNLFHNQFHLIPLET